MEHLTNMTFSVEVHEPARLRERTTASRLCVEKIQEERRGEEKTKRRGQEKGR